MSNSIPSCLFLPILSGIFAVQSCAGDASRSEPAREAVRSATPPLASESTVEIEVDVDAQRCAGVDIGTRFLGLASRAPSIVDWFPSPDFKVEMYEELGVNVVRFPGGEESNNYMWDYATGNDAAANLDIAIPAQGPDGGSPVYDTERYDAGIGPTSSGLYREDYQDQLGHMAQLQNADSNFVVNLESAFVECDANPSCTQPDLDKWAKYAAAWVADVRDSGYFVRYWELGNEPYLGGKVGANANGETETKRNLTADEYADAYLAFTSAMKAADPRIEVGIVGDFQWNHVAPADKPADEDDDAEPIAWWPQVLGRVCTPEGSDRCPQVDFATFHHYNVKYFAERTAPDECANNNECLEGDLCYKGTCRYLDLTSQPDLSFLRNKLTELRLELESRIRPDVPLFATEFNVSNKLAEIVSFQEQLLYVTEVVGNMATSGVNNIQWWPVVGGPGPDPITAQFFLTSTAIGVNYPAYELFRLWKEYLHGVVVPLSLRTDASNTQAHIYAFGTCAYNPNVLSLFVTNKNPEPRTVTINGLSPIRFELHEVSASDEKPKTRLGMEQGTTVVDRRELIEQQWDQVSFTMPPKSLFILSSKNEGRDRLAAPDRVGIYKEDTQEFFLDSYGNGKWNDQDEVAFFGGRDGDQPVVGDFNGDGRSNIGVYRPRNSSFSLQRDYDNTWDFGEERYGRFSSDSGTAIGLVGRWTSPDVEQVALYYPELGQFSFDYNTDQRWDNGVDRRVTTRLYASARPVIGDWDCDPTTGDEFALLLPSGAFELFEEPPGAGFANKTGTINFLGNESAEEDLPISGDWNGDGCDAVGIYRPSQKLFVLDYDGNGVFEFDKDWARRFSISGVPIAGDW
ncbi:MAG: hypothetical protein AAFP04_09490 [Myxococcota bacterium]